MQGQNDKIKIKRRFSGIVVSDKMDKTRVVLVENLKMHKKYAKRFIQTQKFKAHDEKNEFKSGDSVMIEECRPLSKDKKYRIIKKID